MMGILSTLMKRYIGGDKDKPIGQDLLEGISGGPLGDLTGVGIGSLALSKLFQRPKKEEDENDVQ